MSLNRVIRVTDLGATVRSMRLEQGVGLRQLAVMADVRPPNLCAFEKGRGKLSVEKVDRLLKLLGVKVLRNEPTCVLKRIHKQ